MSPLLEIQNLTVGFPQGVGYTKVVDRLSLTLSKGECLALVGESGSGKSISALTTLRLHPAGARILEGAIRLSGEALLDLPEYRMECIRGSKVGMVFQDPMSALNPVMTIGDQMTEALRAPRQKGARERVLALLDQVGLPDPLHQFSAYPHQLSGGMRQRVLIAHALAGEPDLLIADEPTTALDVLLQTQIMTLLNRLRHERGMALWLITHDLAAVEGIADRVVVMQSGKVVEASSGAFFEGPQTTYGQALLNAIPRLSACLNSPHSLEGAPSADGLLRVRDLAIGYPAARRFGFGGKEAEPVIQAINFDLAPGETLAIVGGSGCGKTTLARGLLGMAAVVAGEVQWKGAAIEVHRGRLKREAEIQVVFQDPFSAMNPRMIVSGILEEGLLALHPDMRADERRSRVLECLQAVGLGAEVLERYPHEFSGGQRQRLCIARSLVLRPKILILDEPTSALDVTVQAQVLKLLQDLKDRHGLSYLFITHDLGVVATISDRMAVMARGRIVELGRTRDVLVNPQHPVTRDLIEALPTLRRDL